MNLARTLLPAAASLLLLAAARADDRLAAELLEYDPPTPDWSAILDERIKAGLPVPELPAEGPPPENAAPAQLLEYWRSSEAWKNDAKPSDAVRTKILLAVQEDPSRIPDALKALPASEEAAKTVLSLQPTIPFKDDELREIRAWIFLNGGLLRDELLADARAARWGKYGWEDGAREVLDALWSRDPAAATEICEGFTRGIDANQAAAAAVMLMEKLPAAQAEPWRVRLQATAAESSLAEEVREIAVEALVKRDWPGKEAWVLESLKSQDPGKVAWFSPVIMTLPDHWIPLLTAMVGGANRSAHDHAVELLAGFNLDSARADALRPLLPWLADPAWATASSYLSRLRLVQSMDRVDLPECTKGLMAVMREKNPESGHLLSGAAEALLHYKAKEAVPAMREGLEHCKEVHHRRWIIDSIAGLDGFTPAEAVRAIETYYRTLPTPEAREHFVMENETTLPVTVSIGAHFANSSAEDASLLAALAERVATLEKEEPELAAQISQLIAGSIAPAGRVAMVKRLAEGIATAGEVARELERCREKEWDGSPFQLLVAAGGTTGAFAAVLANDEKAMREALNANGAVPQAAVLAGAKLAGRKLDLPRVAELIGSEDELVRKSALLYLQNSEDPESKELLDQNKPGMASGPRMAWDPGHQTYGEFDDLEDRLRQQLALKDGPKEIFALMSSGYWGGSGQWYVMVYPDRMLAVRDAQGGRIGTCALNEQQIRKLHDYVTTYRADELPPLSLPVADGIQYQYVHATEKGIRRVFMNNPPSTRAGVEQWLGRGGNYSKGLAIYAGLVRTLWDCFEDLPLEYSYGPGIEILQPREEGEIVTLWKKGDDLRVLVKNDSDAMQWRNFSLADRALGGQAEEPAERARLTAKADLHPDFDADIFQFRYPWQVTAGDGTIHNGRFKNVQGLWRCQRGKEPELIAEGSFTREAVSADGKWCAASKAQGRHWAEPNGVVCINLETKEAFAVALEPADNFNVVAFLTSQGKFLIERHRDPEAPGITPEAGPAEREYHILDPVTGALERVKGDFYPLHGMICHSLQPASGGPFMGWAVEGSAEFGTVVGKYNPVTFAFEAVREIEGINFSSDEMWVDEEEGMIYAAVNGDLVRMPMKKE